MKNQRRSWRQVILINLFPETISVPYVGKLEGIDEGRDKDSITSEEGPKAPEWMALWMDQKAHPNVLRGKWREKSSKIWKCSSAGYCHKPERKRLILRSVSYVDRMDMWILYLRGKLMATQWARSCKWFVRSQRVGTIPTFFSNCKYHLYYPRILKNWSREHHFFNSPVNSIRFNSYKKYYPLMDLSGSVWYITISI